MVTPTSCVLITTLVVVSIANLFLLYQVIMYALRTCQEQEEQPNKQVDLIEKLSIQSDQSGIGSPIKDHQKSIGSARFLGALIRLRADDVEFVCAVAIISRTFAITPAHCAKLVSDVPMTNVKITSNSSKVRYGVWHDLDKIVIHENYDPFRGYNDVALINVRQPFKGKNVQAVALPGGSFRYPANSTAMAFGWAKMRAVDQSEQLYGVEVKLFWIRNCQRLYPDERIAENGMFCAGKYRNEKEVCVYDAGSQLVQNNVLMGILAFGDKCAEVGKPAVYTRVAAFESWIRRVETKSGVAISAVFKTL